MKMWLIFTLLITVTWGASVQAQTQQRLDEMTKLRLSQLRSGGVALLPISLTLTMPPGIEKAPVGWQHHLENSMTETLNKLQHNIQVIPPETTMIILNEMYLTEGQPSSLVQGDSLMLNQNTSNILRKRTGSRYIMGMSLASEWMPPELQKAFKGSGEDPIMVACRIWDTQTGQLIWQTQHPWFVPAEGDEDHSKMRELCGEILAKLPK